MVDAGKNRTMLVLGGCFVHHADAPLMIRGGHLDQPARRLRSIEKIW